MKYAYDCGAEKQQMKRSIRDRTINDLDVVQELEIGDNR